MVRRSREFQEVEESREKIRESWGVLHSKVRENSRVKEFKSTRVQKLTKVQKKIFSTNSYHFSCSLRSQIICTSAFKLVSSLLFLV